TRQLLLHWIASSGRDVAVVFKIISDACVAWWTVAIIQHFCTGRPACPMNCGTRTRRQVHMLPDECGIRDSSVGELFSANKGTHIVADLDSFSKRRASHISVDSIGALKDLLAIFYKRPKGSLWNVIGQGESRIGARTIIVRRPPFFIRARIRPLGRQLF